MARLVVVGDALLDRDVEGTVQRLAPDAPVPVVDRPTERSRPGGAGLAAALAAADGHDVKLVTALGTDAAGRELRDLLHAAGVSVVDVGLDAETPEKVRVLADGRPLLRIDRGERRPEAVGPATDDALEAIRASAAILVSDYGRGSAAERGVRSALAAAAGEAPVVWDPHPAGPAPAPGVTLVTPNLAEAARFAAGGDGDGPAAATRGRELMERWQARAVAVTMGARGAVLVEGARHPVHLPAPAAAGDPCGAGDRFASRAAGALATGSSTSDAVEQAVAAASGFVDAGGARAVGIGGPQRGGEASAGPSAMIGDVVELAARERAAGRRVVATGGCFDLLHAGHVRILQAARALGDCLIVCLNSDRSVSALKGPERPIVGQAARAAVLEALQCVDGVLVFDAKTPEAAIERLRPAIWVKGGDYAADELPEADAVRRHGGEVMVLPYVHGHSTTRLIEEAANRHAA
jgi:D-beta-D-heptose 7-phosphate kinase / D-beta-D-heptose 1-phosphate adenosyltransferase